MIFNYTLKKHSQKLNSSIFKIRLKFGKFFTLGLMLLGSISVQAAVSFNVKYALQGAQGAGGNFPLTTVLRSKNLIPSTDPYGLGVTTTSVPNNAVDWVKIELLASAGSSLCVPTQTTAGFLLSDGSIVNADGSMLSFPSALPGIYNIRIRQRNHSALITTPQTLSTVTNATVDFTQAATLENPDNAISLALGMAARLGDVNQDGFIDNVDLNLVYANSGSILRAYVATDVNLDGSVNYLDLGLLNTATNNGSISIPVPFDPVVGASCGSGGIPPVQKPVPALNQAALALLNLMAAIFGSWALRRRNAGTGRLR